MSQMDQMLERRVGNLTKMFISQLVYLFATNLFSHFERKTDMVISSKLTMDAAASTTYS